MPLKRDPNIELRHLMQQHELSQGDVGVILELKLYGDKRRKSTQLCPRVAAWLADPGSTNYRTMSPQLLAMLKLKLPAFLKKRRKQHEPK